MKLTTKKCGCKVSKQGYIEHECKYHKTHCHFHPRYKNMECRKKCISGSEYCKRHDKIMTQSAKESIDGFGGSDF